MSVNLPPNTEFFSVDRWAALKHGRTRAVLWTEGVAREQLVFTAKDLKGETSMILCNTIAGLLAGVRVLSVLFSAMNYFTHIGLPMNTSDSYPEPFIKT
jgi:hypothetical protein